MEVYPSQENPTDETSKTAALRRREQAADTSCMRPFNANVNNNKGAQCIVVKPGSLNGYLLF